MWGEKKKTFAGNKNLETVLGPSQGILTSLMKMHATQRESDSDTTQSVRVMDSEAGWEE